ncbi:probable inactive methyltransferase Os04g0175900 [Phragmites australis]|uniref:probable inactive methyltransferase Os04g0175900 n=1 Tax=Phragmites australis TaxID=29695 RepID=UPI002D77D09F|nr:probable inactive methyltransferase Os04g0175900 [Phragmites australis]
MENHGAVAAGGNAEAEETSFMTAQELITTHIVSMTLKAAMELGLIDALAEAPAGRALTAGELVARLRLRLPQTTPIDQMAAAVDRMLRFLVCHGVVRCATEEEDEGAGPGGAAVRRYAPAPVCRWLSSNQGEGTLAPLAMFGFKNAILMPWHHLAEAVLEGGVAFEMAHGMPAFEHMGKNPQLNALYNQAMSRLSALVCDKLLERFTGFDGIGVLVDVGGGVGTVLGMITSWYKHIKGINFDLPFVVSQAKPIPGVEHVGGNMLDYVPAGDAVFMKSVLHLLSDEDCVKLLKNCHRAIPDNGKVIAMEVVLPATPAETQAGRFPFLFDMICLLNSLKGGKERTERELTMLARDAGFHGAVRSTVVFGGYWALEFTK